MLRQEVPDFLEAPPTGVAAAASEPADAETAVVPGPDGPEQPAPHPQAAPTQAGISMKLTEAS